MSEAKHVPGEWIEAGTHNALPGDKLTAIEHNGFGIVCAILDHEGESVYRILRAVNAHDDLLAALIRLREWVRHPGEDDGPENEAVIEQAEVAIAKAVGREVRA